MDTFMPLDTLPADHLTVRERRLRGAAIGGAVVALLLVAISLGGLTLSSAYARETVSWATQAIAQDWFDLIVAAPCLLITALGSWRGSRRGHLMLAGVLLYAIYTLVIYAFAVHLNSLFLLYCAGLGISLYSLIALARGLGPVESIKPFDPSAPHRIAGAFLVVVGVSFAGLWLADLIPAAFVGRAPRDLAATGVFTNPVHVLDLSFILPLHVLAGVTLWRRRSLGVLLAPVVLAFGVLMAASIGFLVVMMELGAVASGGTPVAIALGIVALISLGLLVQTLRPIDN